MRGGGTILLKIHFYSKSGVHFFGKKPQLLSKKTWNIREKKQRFLFLKKTKSFFSFWELARNKRFFFVEIKSWKIWYIFEAKIVYSPPPSILSTPRQKNVIPHAKSGIFLHPPPPPPRRKKAYFEGFLLYWNGPYRNLIDDYPLYLNYYPKIMQNIIPFFTCITKAFYTTMSKKKLWIYWYYYDKIRRSIKLFKILLYLTHEEGKFTISI